MTKDVIVTISGLQFAQETETEPVEIVTAGSYYKKNGKHYIIYDEVMEGFEGSTKNIIKLTEDSLDVTKKGVTNVHMVFEENKKNITYYNTPFGNLFIGIDAEKIQVEESEDRYESTQSDYTGSRIRNTFFAGNQGTAKRDASHRG